MRRIWITFFVWLSVSGVVFAQEESARNTLSADSADEEDVAISAIPGDHIPVLKNNTTFTEENSYQLNPDQIPASLRSALSEPEYQGWEEGVITRHLLTGEYRIEIGNGDGKKTFMFNTYGERIPDQ